MVPQVMGVSSGPFELVMGKGRASGFNSTITMPNYFDDEDSKNKDSKGSVRVTFNPEEHKIAMGLPYTFTFTVVPPWVAVQLADHSTPMKLIIDVIHPVPLLMIVLPLQCSQESRSRSLRLLGMP
jgi:hypothetical protein